MKETRIPNGYDDDAVDVVNGDSVIPEADWSISDLVCFLKSAFRHNDFIKIEELLTSHEAKRKAAERNLKALEAEVGIDFHKKIQTLEKELNDCRNCCAELTTQEGEKKEEGREGDVSLLKAKLEELEFDKDRVEQELAKCKQMLSIAEEKIANVEQSHRENITRLEEEIKKKEKILCERSIQLKKEIEDSECSKKRAEKELVDCKRRCGELEAKVFNLGQENMSLRREVGENGSINYKRRCGEWEAKVFKLEQENTNLRREVGENGSVIYERHCEDLEAEVLKLELENMSSCCHRKERELLDGVKSGAKELLKETGRETETSRELCELVGLHNESACQSTIRETNLPYVLDCLVDLTTTGEDRENQVRKKLVFQNERSPDNTCAKCSGGIIVIDSDEEMDMPPTNAMNSSPGNSRVNEICTNLEDMASQKSSKMHKDKKMELVEKNTSGLKESITPSVTPKRKRASNVITSDSEGDYDDDDKVPLSKLKMKKLTDLDATCSIYTPVKFSSEVSTNSSGNGNVESITPSRRRIVPLRECENAIHGGKESRSRHLSAEPLPLQVDPLSLLANGEKNAENPEEDEVEDEESDSEGESLGGFIVQGSDVSQSDDVSFDTSGDETEGGFELNQLLQRFRREKKTSKWEYEADMLSSFSKDLELCMKAVCALYRQQTSDEKSMKGSLYANNRGFNKFDALKGSVLAEFLTDGDPHGPLKRTVDELEKHDKKALEYCSELASRYSKQLFEIYQNKEDPHFLPCL